jgi:hypothetical protein
LAVACCKFIYHVLVTNFFIIIVVHTVSTKTRMASINVEATETRARAPSHTSEDARYIEGRVGVDRSTEPHSTFAFFLFFFISRLHLCDSFSHIVTDATLTLNPDFQWRGGP